MWCAKCNYGSENCSLKFGSCPQCGHKTFLHNNPIKQRMGKRLGKDERDGKDVSNYTPEELARREEEKARKERHRAKLVAREKADAERRYRENQTTVARSVEDRQASGSEAGAVAGT